MSKQAVLYVRIPLDLMELLDARVDEESLASPGRRVTRADVVRELLYGELAGGSAAVPEVRARPAREREDVDLDVDWGA